MTPETLALLAQFLLAGFDHNFFIYNGPTACAAYVYNDSVQNGCWASGQVNTTEESDPATRCEIAAQRALEDFYVTQQCVD